MAGLLLALGAGWMAVERMYPLTGPPTKLPAAPKPPCDVPCNPYRPPTAVPRATSSLPGRPVTLDGNGSTFNYGGPLTFRWTLTSRPPGSRAAITNADRSGADFIADKTGEYTATLTVHDGLGASAPAPIGILVRDTPDVPPPEVTVNWQRDASIFTIDLTYAYWLIPLIAIPFAFLLYRYWERRVILDRVRKEDLPRPHDIRTLALPGDPSVDAGLRAAVRTLRRPFLGSPRLHVGKSIMATVKAAGYPTLVFEPTRRHAEYLILIDTLARRDHQSELFPADGALALQAGRIEPASLPLRRGSARVLADGPAGRAAAQRERGAHRVGVESSGRAVDYVR